MLVNLPDTLRPIKPLMQPHKGLVVDNKDPENLKRVRVTIDGLISGVIENLPWCNTLSNPRECNIPDLNDELYVIFPFNSIYFPFYLGYWNNNDNKIADFTANYPDVMGYADADGNKFLVNKKTGETKIMLISGFQLDISNSGDITASPGGTVTLTTSKFTVDGNVVLGGGGDSAVLFSQLKSLLSNLIDQLATHTHTSTAPGTPTSPPITAAVISLLSNTIDLAKSLKVKLD